jgi:hypothetical protein
MSEANTVTRLAASKDVDGQPFLRLHHLAAADRLEALIARAQLMPRVTMSYSPAAVGGSRSSANVAADISDSAAGARQRINAIAASLPADCWSVMFDVCAFGRGLQDIETERRWPRRSAKLVLRIGLDQLAAQFGLAPHQAGTQGRPVRGWLDERLPLIADSAP